MPKFKKKSEKRDFDNPWKYALRLFLEKFMNFCLPRLALPIDWSRGYESLDKELQKIIPTSQIGKRISDLLFKVWLKNGEEKWILIHLEVQSQKSNDFAHRMFIYSYRTYDQYQKPVVSIALLLDNDFSWRPDSFFIEDPLTQEYYLHFRYHVVKLLDYKTRKEELCKRNDLFAMMILAQLTVMETKKNPIQRVQHKLALIRALLNLGLTNEETRGLLTFIDWLIIIPEDLMLTYKEEIQEITDEWEIPYVSTFEKIARIEGRQEGIRMLVDKQIRRRFPKTVTTQHLHLINKANVDTLACWAEKLIDAKTIEEVFAVS